MASTTLSYDDFCALHSTFDLVGQLVSEGDEVKMELADDGKIHVTATSAFTLTPGSSHNNPPEQV